MKRTRSLQWMFLAGGMLALWGCPQQPVDIEEASPTAPGETTPPFTDLTPTLPVELTPSITPDVPTPSLTPEPTDGPTPSVTPPTPTETPQAPTPTGTPLPPTPVLEDLDQDGFTTEEGDCDDQNPDLYPTAVEIPYDTIDQDCSGSDLTDVDQDGYDAVEAGGEDCLDLDQNSHPGVQDFADDIDNDCDGQIDEDVDQMDRDKDGWTTAEGDCNDLDGTVYPGSSEIPYDGIDQDCSGLDVTDADQDGFDSSQVSGGTDCNDQDKNVNPDRSETCNKIDDNCDGQVDEGVQLTWYPDADKDGYGDSSAPTSACTAPKGYIAQGGDCRDTNDLVNPGKAETCNGIDDNCDGSVDNGVTNTYFLDGDKDGFGNPHSPTAACSKPDGYVTDQTDCNDSDAAVHPGATEVCNLTDDDCDGSSDEDVQTTFYQDRDDDGFGNAGVSAQACAAPDGYVSSSTDCNDRNVDVYPGAPEYCNGRDDNCDGTADEPSNTQGVSTYYQDSDGDGYGNPAASTQACSQPTGYVSNKLDCNDSDINAYPSATERCNAQDDDCDGQVDEGAKTSWYRDADGDGYGTPYTSVVACDQPEGYVANLTDCNDGSATTHPGAEELCNGSDDDCDAQVDEGVQQSYYQDWDADGYGNAEVSIQSCKSVNGYVPDSTDCDDSSSDINPGADEVCNGMDDNCDLDIDEGVQLTWYLDNDKDGYGNPSQTTEACTLPAGYSSDASDCNDASASIRPGATESCNGADDNCNGQIDEGVKPTWYLDADGDGYGLSSSTTQACSKPAGYAAVGGDCDDSQSAVSPGAQDVCDGKDNNCNSTVDEACGTGTLSISHQDYDVDTLGRMITINNGSSNQVDVRCYDSAKSLVGSLSLSTDTSIQPMNMTVVMAPSGDYAIASWRGYYSGDTTKNGVFSRIISKSCQAISPMFRSIISTYGEFHDSEIDDQGNAVVAENSGSTTSIRWFTSSGSLRSESSFSASGYGTHLAINHQTGAGVIAVQTCHSGDCLSYRRWSSPGTFSDSALVKVPAGYIYWYDGMTVGMNNNNDFVIQWRYQDNSHRAAFYSSNGTLVKQVTFSSRSSGESYYHDPFRRRHSNIQTQCNDFILGEVYSSSSSDRSRIYYRYTATGNLVEQYTTAYTWDQGLSHRLVGNGLSHFSNGSSIDYRRVFTSCQ